METRILSVTRNEGGVFSKGRFWPASTIEVDSKATNFAANDRRFELVGGRLITLGVATATLIVGHASRDSVNYSR